MNGSEKQVKWAEDIRAGKNFDAMLGHGRSAEATRIIEKVVTYITSNDNAAFWIDYRDSSAMEIARDLMSCGLQVRGLGFEHRAKMAPDGTITVTWQAIVQDGKGGHKETRSKTL